jgi:hypothetical protein
MKTSAITYLLISMSLGMVNLKSFAQQTVTWSDFSEISYEEKLDSSTQVIYMMPIFDTKLKAIDGKAVSITGYLFPVDPASGYYILKADDKPFGCCMSHAGNPNEIIEIRFENIDSKLLEKYANRQITVTGNFELNDNDVMALDLILESAMFTTDK